MRFWIGGLVGGLVGGFVGGLVGRLVGELIGGMCDVCVDGVWVGDLLVSGVD